MKLKVGFFVAVFVIMVTQVTACGVTDRPTTSVQIQPEITPTLPTATPTLFVPEWPSARKYGAMVYDPVSERIFMFGGVKGLFDSADIPEIWAYEPANNRWQ